METRPWLPEPLLTDGAPDVAQSLEDADSLSMAFLLLLERLTPVERAVFLLHDVFDRSVINPDKLGHLGPLADVRVLFAQRSREG
jgi:hypothetical protein